MKKKNSTIPAQTVALHFVAVETTEDEVVETKVEKKAKKVVVLEPTPEVAPEPAPAPEVPVEEVKVEEVAAAAEEVK